MSLLQCTSCTRSRTKDSPAGLPYKQNRPYTSGLTQEGQENIIRAGNDFQCAMMATVSFEPNPKHYELYTVIGHACNDAATISLAKHLPSQGHIAIKKTDLESCNIDFSILQNEIIMCRQLQHDKILPYLSTFVHNKSLWTVMPLMAYGSCKDLIHAYFTSGIPEQASSYIIRDTLLALEHLHSKGIIHRGVRASHILIAANGVVCLSGLRNAYHMVRDGERLRIVHDYPRHCVNSLQWLSPEILEQNIAGYDTKSDIYSLGVTACEMANGFAPFIDMPVTQMLLEKVNGTKPVLADSTTIAELIGNDAEDYANNKEVVDMANQRRFTSQFHNFVDLCLEKDPSSRPTAATLLGHGFFKHLKKKTSEILPSLLQPLSPLTDISKLPKAPDTTIDDITADINTLDVEEPWDFI